MRSAQKVLQTGFTLIELLIVISIIAIITGASIPSFNTYISNQNLKQAQEQIKDDLRTVQNRAINGQEATKILDGSQISYWGVRFQEGTNTYTYFTSVDTSVCGAAATTEDYRVSDVIQGGYVVRNVSGCVFFSFANGDAFFNPAGINTIIVGPETGNTGCRRIDINSSGLVRSDTTDESCI